MNQHVRAGIVGTGFAAQFHMQMIRRVFGVSVEPTCVFSPTAKHRESFAAQHQIAASASLGELIDSVDVVHVCTPAATHEEIAISALEAGRNVIIEKPLTGYFSVTRPEAKTLPVDPSVALREATASARRILEKEGDSSGRVAYAENWVYAPAVQKEREILERTKAQVLWITGEESHSGSHSPYYGRWEYSGGGSIIGKGVHPITAAIYLKAVEGRCTTGAPIRPQSVSARTHRLTGLESYRDAGFLRTEYHDVEDFGAVHIVFEDGTIADLFASEVVLGGVHNWLKICCNTHRSQININPNTALQTYNPSGPQFDGIYTVEKIETQEGWVSASPDEEWMTGYQTEMQAFYTAFAGETELESNGALGAATVATVYAAYLSASRDGTEVQVP